jgi:ABC-type phosphate transport system permease subunit
VEQVTRRCRKSVPNLKTRVSSDAVLTEVKLLFLFEIWSLTFNENWSLVCMQQTLFLDRVPIPPRSAVKLITVQFWLLLCNPMVGINISQTSGIWLSSYKQCCSTLIALRSGIICWSNCHLV